MKFFEGCTTLITGASSGLGDEFARQLAPHVGTLVLVARRVDRLERLRDELLSLHQGLQVLIYGADLSDESARQNLVNWLEVTAPPIDFLINNAGLGDHGEFVTSDWDRVKSMLDVNIAALTHLTHLLAPGMAESGRAAILNVSSVASFFPLPNMAVYSATKAYVTSFSEAIAIELRPKGITVTALCPGPVKTEFFSVAERVEGGAPHYDSMPLFVVTPAEAVRAGLEAVAADRARVVPGPILAIAVFAALLIPFVIIREVLRRSAGRL
ncbi:MAG: SDR family oxidoreductase [Terrimicrobiaceae bacterium]